MKITMKDVKTIGVILCIIPLLYLNHKIWIYLGIEFPPEIPVVERYIGTTILSGLVCIGLLFFGLLYVYIRDIILKK